MFTRVSALSHEDLKLKTLWLLTPPISDRARNEIIRINTPLARKAAGAFFPCVPPTVAAYDDLLQLCLIGINHAINTYDETRGPFIPHMKVKMQDSMRKWRRDHALIPRKAVELYDAVRSRHRLIQRLSGEDVPLTRVAVQSLGLSVEDWRAIEDGYTAQW